MFAVCLALGTRQTRAFAVCMAGGTRQTQPCRAARPPCTGARRPCPARPPRLAARHARHTAPPAPHVCRGPDRRHTTNTCHIINPRHQNEALPLVQKSCAGSSPSLPSQGRRPSSSSVSHLSLSLSLYASSSTTAIWAAAAASASGPPSLPPAGSASAG